ncbi:MAG: tRNA (adenosine(37)-N6)-threonylcarbamoyltransferase complex transferase subunit TsaD [bacterium]|nr:tRNA (adenosine(37)-N6)-threonylcarbamoyltransferase complex transferase subunit TsaD [bacterium]
MDKCSYILGIDTSCDDTAIAILRYDGALCADVVYSQNEQHAEFGGVVPEISSRQHLQDIAIAIKNALSEAKLDPKNISAVGVTFGPGLVGSLLVGVQFAKGFAQSLGVPIVGIHHIEGHLMASYGSEGYPDGSFVALVASGGHSALYKCDADFNYEILGETRDDAAGEAFDKIGRFLGLEYPAGKVIDELAEKGDASKYIFPVALRSKSTLEYSFSGLKTSARLLIARLVKEHGEIKGQVLFDVCAGLRKAVVDALLDKAFLACEQEQIRDLVLGGGVTANSFIRSEAISRGKKHNINVCLPQKNHCVDNGVMIAKAALKRILRGQSSDLSFGVDANISIVDSSSTINF